LRHSRFENIVSDYGYRSNPVGNEIYIISDTQSQFSKQINHKIDESHLLPNISFLRKLFSSNPGAMPAAKAKAQGIIDDNAVGE
jgi:hypothetical protein